MLQRLVKSGCRLRERSALRDHMANAVRTDMEFFHSVADRIVKLNLDDMLTVFRVPVRQREDRAVSVAHQKLGCVRNCLVRRKIRLLTQRDLDDLPVIIIAIVEINAIMPK